MTKLFKNTQLDICDPKIENFLKEDTEANAIKKVDKVSYTKIEIFHVIKDTVNKIERQGTMAR